MSLERRCDRLATAYPDAGRRAEVATTLLEASEGRRRPRLGDALNVLWHGVAARAARAGGPAAEAPRAGGLWRDAAAVAVVQAVVLQAALAAVVAAHAFQRPASSYPVYPDLPRYPTGGPMFYSAPEAAMAVVAALLAVLTALAACRGRVLLVRAGVLTTALAGLGAVVATRLSGNAWTFTTPAARTAALTGMLTAALLLGTRAASRAAAAVPRWWWGCAATGSVAAAAAVVAAVPRLGLVFSRGSLVTTSYAAQAGLLIVLALPLVRRAPAVPVGAVLAGGLAATGIAAAADETGGAWLVRLALGAAVCAALVVGATVPLRRAWRGAGQP